MTAIRLAVRPKSVTSWLRFTPLDSRVRTVGSFEPPTAPSRVPTGRDSGFTFVIGDPPKTLLMSSPVATAAILPVSCGNKPARTSLTTSFAAWAPKIFLRDGGRMPKRETFGGWQIEMVHRRRLTCPRPLEQ